MPAKSVWPPLRTMNELWLINDGATHHVVARTQQEALACYVLNGLPEGSDWPAERPTVTLCNRRKTYRLDIHSRVLELTGAEWSELVQHPTYLGCSEY